MSKPPTGHPRPDEFTTFMRAYQDMVFSTAARLTSRDAQAEDIAQEVFLRAYEHYDMLRDNPAAGGWLKTVARNLSLNYLSRQRHRWRLFSELPASEEAGAPLDLDSARPGSAGGDSAGGDSAATDPPLADLGLEERRALVDEALRALPEHQRLPLVLYHFEELSYADIAAQLHISLGKAKTDLHRGRLSLLQRLQAHGIGREVLET